MSNYIVLIKQVPDVTQITDNAFDPETGTLIRSRLASTINELDSQALAFANQMRQAGGDGKIIALTMGPPTAQEVLRYSLSRCADMAVLLTCRATKKENEDFENLSRTLNELAVSEVGRIDKNIKKKLLVAAGERFHKKALEDMINGLELTEPTYKGEVWVVAEHSAGVIHPATFELIGKGCELADSLETKVGVCLAGYRPEPMAKELIAAGADNIYIIDDKLLEVFDPTAYRRVIADAISTYRPQIVLFGATARGRMLAPMLSYGLGCGLTADCTSFDIRDSSRTGQIAILLQTRPALGGNVMATICTKNSKSQMATARPGVMKRLPADNSRTGKVLRHKVQLSRDDISLEIIRTELGTGEVSFNAEVIVGGGKGMQSRDSYERLVSLSWRLKRVCRIQNQTIDALNADNAFSPLKKLTQSLSLNFAGKALSNASGFNGELALGRLAIKDFANARVLDRLLMYERRIENSLYKTILELQRLNIVKKLNTGSEMPFKQLTI